MRVLLTGATGYVGGRLLPRLEAAGHEVRALARDPAKLAGRVPPGVAVARGDLLDRASLDAATEGIEAAYYLVHSMGSEDFEEKDRRAARNFADATRAAGVARVVYLGGLGRGDLSPHLASRQEVGRILREEGPPTIEFRAAVVVGAGSTSFELVRALVERLPVMVTPRWVRTPTQPIAIDDVVEYLLRALDLPEGRTRVYEIGGADVVGYGDVMRAYARARGYLRVMVPVPVLTPGLSSLWLALVTPVLARTGRKLIEGVRNATVVEDRAALRDFSVRPRGIRASVREALAEEDRRLAAIDWEAKVGRRLERVEGVVGGRRFDTRATEVEAPPASAFAPVRRLGGGEGWYASHHLWRARGALDRAAGGPGTARPRRHPDELREGDVVGGFRVERVDAPSRLLLRAEMRIPGRGWLDFEIAPSGNGSRIRQTTVFDPHGVAGRLYWWALLPFHRLVLARLLRSIAARAVREEPQAL